MSTMATEETVLVVAEGEDPELAMLKGVPNRRASQPATAASMTSVTAILHWSGSKSRLQDAFQRCANLRWVHSRAAGLNNCLFPELVNSDVQLTNSKGIFSAALGEFALGAILYFAKDFLRMRRQQAERVWNPFEVERIAGRLLGIVGYGDIGRAVAVRAHAMGMRILATRRHRPQEADPLVAHHYSPAELHAMLTASDYVVVAAPLTPETHHMIGEGEFAVMKSNCILINVGRGPVIDEHAMIQALKGRRIRGAALDVVENEPLPLGHPLYEMNNVLLSPHCADNVVGWKIDAMQFFLSQYERFKNNEPLLNVVDKCLGY